MTPSVNRTNNAVPDPIISIGDHPSTGNQFASMLGQQLTQLMSSVTTMHLDLKPEAASVARANVSKKSEAGRSGKGLAGLGEPKASTHESAAPADASSDTTTAVKSATRHEERASEAASTPAEAAAPAAADRTGTKLSEAAPQETSEAPNDPLRLIHTRGGRGEAAPSATVGPAAAQVGTDGASGDASAPTAAGVAVAHGAVGAATGAAGVAVASAAAGEAETAGIATSAGTSGGSSASSASALSALGARGSVATFADRVVQARLQAANAKTPAGAVEVDPLEDQIAQGLAAAFKSKDGTVTLQLSPDELGRMTIELKFEDAQVVAKFQVSKQSTLDLVVQTADTLKKTLEDRGITVDRVEISVAPAAKPEAAKASSGSDSHASNQGTPDGGNRGGESGTSSGGGRGWDSPERRGSSREPVWNVAEMGADPDGLESAVSAVTVARLGVDTVV